MHMTYVFGIRFRFHSGPKRKEIKLTANRQEAGRDFSATQSSEQNLQNTDLKDISDLIRPVLPLLHPELYIPKGVSIWPIRRART